MCPFVGYSNPRINFTVLDLPEPFGPSSPKTSPRRTSKSALSTARALGRPQKSLKTLVSPRTETITSPLVLGEMSPVVMLIQIDSTIGPRVPVVGQASRLPSNIEIATLKLSLTLTSAPTLPSAPARLDVPARAQRAPADNARVPRLCARGVRC